jgi:hypothetical protein
VTVAGDQAETDFDVGQALIDQRDDAVAPGGTAGWLGHGLTIPSAADRSLI